MNGNLTPYCESSADMNIRISKASNVEIHIMSCHHYVTQAKSASAGNEIFNPHPVIRGLWGPGRHENCHYLKKFFEFGPGFPCNPQKYCLISFLNVFVFSWRIKKNISNLMKTVRRPPTGPPRPGSYSSLLWLRFKFPKHWKSWLVTL